MEGNFMKLIDSSAQVNFILIDFLLASYIIF